MKLMEQDICLYILLKGIDSVSEELSIPKGELLSFFTVYFAELLPFFGHIESIIKSATEELGVKAVASEFSIRATGLDYLISGAEPQRSAWKELISQNAKGKDASIQTFDTTPKVNTPVTPQLRQLSSRGLILPPQLTPTNSKVLTEIDLEMERIRNKYPSYVSKEFLRKPDYSYIPKDNLA